MLYPCLLSNIIYPLYLGGGCGRGVGHPNILNKGGPPAKGGEGPSHHPPEPPGAVHSASRPSDMAIPAFRTTPECLAEALPELQIWLFQPSEHLRQSGPGWSTSRSGCCLGVGCLQVSNKTTSRLNNKAKYTNPTKAIGSAALGLGL